MITKYYVSQMNATNIEVVHVLRETEDYVFVGEPDSDQCEERFHRHGGHYAYLDTWADAVEWIKGKSIQIASDRCEDFRHSRDAMRRAVKDAAMAHRLPMDEPKGE